MDMLVFNGIKEIQRCWKAVSCLYLGILLLCGHCVFMVNLEMYKAIIIYQILHCFICIHNNVGRDRDLTIVVQFISVSLNYVTCEILIHLVDD